MIRVYKTTVNDRTHAKSIKKEISKYVPGSIPTFDLDDYDNVLRIENSGNDIDESAIQKILRNYGYTMNKLL